MLADEAGGVAAGLGIQDIVDVALAPDGDVLGLVLRDRRIAHARKEFAQLFRLGVGEFDEFEAVGAGRVVLGDLGYRSVVRKRTHILLHAFDGA